MFCFLPHYIMIKYNNTFFEFIDHEHFNMTHIEVRDFMKDSQLWCQVLLNLSAITTGINRKYKVAFMFSWRMLESNCTKLVSFF